MATGANGGAAQPQGMGGSQYSGAKPPAAPNQAQMDQDYQNFLSSRYGANNQAANVMGNYMGGRGAAPTSPMMPAAPLFMNDTNAGPTTSTAAPAGPTPYSGDPNVWGQSMASRSGAGGLPGLYGRFRSASPPPQYRGYEGMTGDRSAQLFAQLQADRTRAQLGASRSDTGGDAAEAGRQSVLDQGYQDFLNQRNAPQQSLQQMATLLGNAGLGSLMRNNGGLIPGYAAGGDVAARRVPIAFNRPVDTTPRVSWSLPAMGGVGGGTGGTGGTGMFGNLPPASSVAPLRPTGAGVQKYVAPKETTPAAATTTPARNMFNQLSGMELLTAKMFGRYPKGFDVKAAQNDMLARAFAGGFGHQGGYGHGGDH